MVEFIVEVADNLVVILFLLMVPTSHREHNVADNIKSEHEGHDKSGAVVMSAHVESTASL